MEQLKQIAEDYKNLFMTGKTMGNPYYFMMYKNIEKLIENIENETTKQVEQTEEQNLGL